VSVHLRIALTYGGLFALVIVAVVLGSYAFVARTSYEDVDRDVQTQGRHVASTLREASTSPYSLENIATGDLVIHLYDADGGLLASSDAPDGEGTVPRMDPRVVLEQPAGPPFDPIAALSPSLTPSRPEPGAFATVTATGQRWRIFVRPLDRAQTPYRYVEVVGSLDRIDNWLATFREILLVLSISGIVVAVGGSWVIATSALKPVGDMIAVADTIARTRDFSSRVAVPRRHGQLRRLAETFNEMLISLEEAYRVQQRLVAAASHELRAPLTAVQGNLEILERHPDLPARERQEALREATHELRRLVRLVNDLLTLARADLGLTPRLERVAVDDLLMAVFMEARPLANGRRFDVDQLEAVFVQGDRDWLRQLLLILVDNALKYTPPNGTVLLELQREGDAAQMTVRDSGVGIAADDLPHVFERFFRADPARTRSPDGAGLGLAIARWIVEQHHGTIALTSEPEHGTTATVRLPSIE
jgi:signal transduction histidine kinase